MTTPTHEPRCDLLVVGAGPAGMAAALAAAPSGKSVTLIDDNAAPGGQIWRAGPTAKHPAQLLRMRESLSRLTNVRVLCGTRVVALGNPSTVLLEGADRAWTQAYEQLILCTGAQELLLPFPGWTLPGVTGAGGLQALIKGGLSVAGQRIVVAGSGPLLLAVAATAGRAGARVQRVAEQAAWSSLATFTAGLPRWPSKVVQAIALSSAKYRAASSVLAAEGDTRLRSVRLHEGWREREIACDRLACGFGLIPNTQLGQLLGCESNLRSGLAVDALQATSINGVYAAGECTGIGGSEKALVEGAIAGHAAIGNHDAARALWPQRARWQSFADAVQRSFALPASLKQLPRHDTLVCRCEDVSHGALSDCTGWIDAKLRTRCGMGACQGRVCGAATQFLFAWTPGKPGHLLAPARIGSLAAADGGVGSKP